MTDGEKSSATGDALPLEEGVTDNPRQQKTVGKSAQPPTREESILRDVVIEHMNGSGLDVIGAEFAHFDHSHMGEGEGTQAYGWGTYVTEGAYIDAIHEYEEAQRK